MNVTLRSALLAGFAALTLASASGCHRYYGRPGYFGRGYVAPRPVYVQSGYYQQPVYQQPVYQQPQPVQAPPPVATANTTGTTITVQANVQGQVALPSPYIAPPVQPAYVAPAAPPPAEIIVAAPPPPPAVAPMEPQGLAPSTQHVWVPGQWQYDGNTYVWVPGTWVVRPSPQAVWVPGGWRPHARGHVWVRGGWH